jgi:hypothetical protein
MKQVHQQPTAPSSSSGGSPIPPPRRIDDEKLGAITDENKKLKADLEK